jgi:hypothetical protein
MVTVYLWLWLPLLVLLAGAPLVVAGSLELLSRMIKDWRPPDRLAPYVTQDILYACARYLHWAAQLFILLPGVCLVAAVLLSLIGTIHSLYS